MAKKNKDDKETLGIRHIFTKLVELSNPDEIDDMVKYFDDLVINNQKYAQIKKIVNMSNNEYAKMTRLYDEIVKESEDKNG